MNNYSYNHDHNKKSNLNILIVDDDQTSLELFKDLLEFRGHTVVTLNEGVRCISNLQSNNYDVIFLDYHIGDIDGVDLADFIKDIFKHKSLIFAYTGDSSNDAINKFKVIGMNGVFIKPLNILKFDSIMNIIESSKELRKTNDDSMMIF